jgi:DNA-binding NtrC family response regulator
MVGYDNVLMRLRSNGLSRGGHQVHEAYTVDDALHQIQRGSIDLLLICHTVSSDEEKKLIASVRSMNQSLPILCITTQEFAWPAEECPGGRYTLAGLLGCVQVAETILQQSEPETS